eukprot:scaffold42929_cov69-Phaeocystis_antarctica.AAC.11
MSQASHDLHHLDISWPCTCAQRRAARTLYYPSPLSLPNHSPGLAQLHYSCTLFDVRLLRPTKL